MRSSAFHRTRNGKLRWYASIGPERKQVPIPPSIASADTPRDKRAAELWAVQKAVELEQERAVAATPPEPACTGPIGWPAIPCLNA